MGSSDMDDGHSLLDAIDESEFSFVNDVDASASAFSWADDLLSKAEGGDELVPNESTTVTTSSAGLSLPQPDGTLQQGSGTSITGQTGVLGFTPQSFQLLQTSKDIGTSKPMQTLTSTGVINQFSNAGQGSGSQLMSGNQFILKMANGAQIQLQAQPQFQLCSQPGTTTIPTTNQAFIQQIQPTTTMFSRTATPTQNPVPSSSPLMSCTPNQSSKNLAIVTMPGISSHSTSHVKSISPSPNVNIVHVPTQQQVISNTLPIQGLLAQVQNPSLSNNGFPQGQTVIPGQGQNIVNTQNTVIQNPNVVNLNVAHVLCSGQPVAGQQPSNVGSIHAVQNQVQSHGGIQGTIIQTADGKSILIPTHQLTASQPVNIQNLSGLTVQPSLNIAQQSGATSSNPGNVSYGNFIRFAQNSGQEKTHFVGVNQHGQQILLQKPAVTGGSSHPQNIILRTLNPGSNVIQIQQQAGNTPQTTQTQPFSAPTQSAIITSSQQGIPAQGLLSTQGQQLKIINQGGLQLGAQNTRMININGQNISLQQLNSGFAGQQNLQFVQQQVTDKSSTTNAASTSGHMVQQQIPDKSRSTAIPFSASQTFNAMSQNIGTTPGLQSSNLIKSATASNSSLVHHLSQQQVSSQTALPVPQQQSHVIEPAFTQLLSQTAQKPKMQQTFSAVTSIRSPSQSGQIFPQSKMLASQSEMPYQEQSTVKFSIGQPTSLHTLSTASPQLSSLVHGTPQPLVKSIQNVNNPMSEFAVSPTVQHTSSISTANSTAVTTTISQSAVSMTQMSVASSLTGVQVISSTQGLQTTAGVMSSQSSEQIVNSGVVKTAQTSQGLANVMSKLQTIQLTVEAQQQLQQIQVELKALAADKNQNTTQQKQRVQQLQLWQKRIIAQGHLQYLQSVQKTQQAQLAIVQNQAAAQTQVSTQLSTTAGQLLTTKSGNGSSPVIAGQAILSQAGVLSSLDTANQVQTRPQMKSPVRSATSSPSPVSTLPVSSNQINMTPVQLQQAANTNVAVVPSTVIHHGAPPGKLPIPASPSSQAIPTQIQIGSQLLTLTLTAQQKEKLLAELAKMTPEQQQLFFRQKQPILISQQQQQHLQAQIQAQKQMQKQQQQQQQQKLLIVNPQKTSIPINVPVQHQADKGNGSIKTDLQPGALSPSQGIKRSVISEIPRANFLHQQLSKDQSLALKPDLVRSFTSVWDASRRLLRYHVFQDRLPRKESLIKNDRIFFTKAEELMKKKDSMFAKYQQLLLEESMREKPSAEVVMIERMLNQDLTSVLEKEKKIVKDDPDDFVPMPLEYLKSEESEPYSKKIKLEPSDRMESGCLMKSRSDVKEEACAIDSNISDQTANFSQISSIKSEPVDADCNQTCGKVKLVIRNDGLGFTSAFAPDSDVKKEDLSTSYSSEEVLSEAEKTLHLDSIYQHAIKRETITSDEGDSSFRRYENTTLSHSDISYTESENLTETDGDAVVESQSDSMCVNSTALSVDRVDDLHRELHDNNIHRTSLHSDSDRAFIRHAGSIGDQTLHHSVSDDGNLVSDNNSVAVSLPPAGDSASVHIVKPNDNVPGSMGIKSILKESQQTIESILPGSADQRHNFDASSSDQPVAYNSALYEPISPVSSYQEESMDFDLHMSQFLQNYSVPPGVSSSENTAALSQFQSTNVQSSSSVSSHTVTGSSTSDIHSLDQQIKNPDQNLTNFNYLSEYPNSFPQSSSAETRPVSTTRQFSDSNSKLLLSMHMNKNRGDSGERSLQVISDDDSNADRIEFSSEPDPQQELLNAQMQSAINSILSLNRDSAFSPSTYQLDQADSLVQQDTYSTDQSESQCEAEDDRCEDSTADLDSQDSQIDDDLDAA